ncbi:MAG TPA: DUF3078 domain-containing protein [Chitinophagaceae bacterium]|nr:DUF3078 domain-containing protein [Chitinophagaceae bacterium]
MKKIILSAITLATLIAATAQDATVKQLKEASDKKINKDPNDTIPALWKKGGLFTLNLAQGSLSNWQGGGDKSSFSAVAFANLFAYYKNGKHAWDNTLDLGYGYVSTTSLGTRKSDDRIDLLSKYGYDIGKKWYLSTLFNFRTQFSPGYAYTDVGGTQVKTLTSDLLAPAYVLLSLGLDWKPTDYFSVFISPVTERWTIVTDDTLSAKGAFGVTPGKKSFNELGAFLSANFNKEIITNVTYKTRLDLFSNYKKDPQNVDLYWTNVIAMKINKFLSANLALDFLYDNDAIGRIQIRQLLGVGFSAKF